MRIIVLLLLFAAPAFPADLSTVPRTIDKEPTYTGTPRYGLLVFGPNAVDRVWVVHDGDTLYVDRNGNGDLTDDGLPARLPKKKTTDPRPEFTVPEIRVGGRVHKNLTVTVFPLARYGTSTQVGTHPATKAILAADPSALMFVVGLEVEHPSLTGDGDGKRIQQSTQWVDRTGPLVFAKKPADAPILHFAGPLTLSPEENYRLRLGRENDLRVNVVTPGLGTGSQVHLYYMETIPIATATVTATVTFPPKDPGAPPVKALYELKDWC